MAEMCPKMLTPGGQNMQLRKKSHEIKKFHHVLKGHVQLFYWAEGPQGWAEGSPLIF